MLKKTDSNNKSLLRPLKDRFILLEILSSVAIVLFIYIFVGVALTFTFNSHVEDSLFSYVNYKPDSTNWAAPSHAIDKSLTHVDSQNAVRNFTIGIVTREDGSVISFYLGNYDLSLIEMKNISLTCINRGTQFGFLNDYHLRYCIAKSGNYYRVALFDMSVFYHYRFVFNILMMMIGLFVTLIVALISNAEVNWLMAPLDESLTQQKQFTADASHELKTPLTVIKANVNILKAHPENTVADQIKWINYIDDESTKMKDLIQDMLYLAKTDSLKEGPVMQPLSLTDLLFEVYLPFESLAFEDGINIGSDIADGLTIHGDVNTLRRLIATLIENALKYAGDGGTVLIKGYMEAERAVISINNTGDVIPKEKLSHLFERFYRVDESRTGTSGGFGLGLAIAKNIADQHHAQLKVTSDETSGTTFKVIFPAYE